MLELCLIKVFEKFLHITFENVYFSFSDIYTVLWGPYNKKHIA